MKEQDIILLLTISQRGFPGGSAGKESCIANLGLIPRLGRSPGEGNGNPHQNSCQENSMDRGSWWATVHGVAELDVTERLYFLSLGPQWILPQKQLCGLGQLMGSSYKTKADLSPAWNQFAVWLVQM